MNNTVNGKPLVYLENISHHSIDYLTGQILLINCDNITIPDQTIINTSIGIYIKKSTNLDISNCNISNNNAYGIILSSIEDVSIKNSTCSRNHLSGMSCSNARNITITEGKFCLNFEQGIDFSETINSKLDHNKINNNSDYGLSLFAGNNHNQITNNSIAENGWDGIFVYMSDNNSIINNIISLNEDSGIRLDGIGNIISRNYVSLNQDSGIYVRYNDGRNVISKNTITANDEEGIKITRSDNNTIDKNNISNNPMGIQILYSNNNFVYHNNFVNNTLQASVDGLNDWNHHYPIGGNYWSDYTGTDKYSGPHQNLSGYDYIGDIPYYIDGEYNEDSYPLIFAFGDNPPYANFSYLGNNLTVLFNGSSSIDRDGSVITYEWNFGDNTTGEGKIIFHNYSSEGRYNVTLTVTDNEQKNHTTVKTIFVDSTPPKIIDYTPSDGDAGKPFTFNATVIDNFRVAQVWVVYWYDPGAYFNLSMNNNYGDVWQRTISINITSETLTYYLIAVDFSNNFNVSYPRVVKINPNLPPGTPTITGEINGKIKTTYEYTFTSVDLKEDMISYYVDWDDGTSEIWTEYFPSGEGIKLNHSWSKKGTYNIRAKAKDVFGAESEWGSLKVTMPKNKTFVTKFPVLKWLLERFPTAFPILRHMMGV
jgi:parallel beta-helix repeat protein